MYNTADTIVAVSSGLAGRRKIIRLAGSNAFKYFSTLINKKDFKRGIAAVEFAIDNIRLPANLYIFPSPNSYTGDDIIEVHLDASNAVVEALIADITKNDVRLAEPGEFTARAFLNGQIGLAQAEAVAQIVSAGSETKLIAAQKLLSGRPSKTIADIRQKMLELMSLIEAGLDFSDQDIQLNTRENLLQQTRDIKKQLHDLLDGCIRYETLIDLPSAAIAGAPNAGKSSLINTILGWERSIVSNERATTRDVLAGELELENNKCLIFDCAGLISENLNIIDELAQAAAIEAIKNSAVVLFCIEAVKDDYEEDIAAISLIRKNFNGPLLCIVTKADLLENEPASGFLKKINIAENALFISSKTGDGIDLLKQRIDELLAEAMFSAGETTDAVAINQRHIETVEQAVGNIINAEKEIASGKEELAAMFLRSSYEVLAGIENEPVDEQMLERIFSSFCIGK